MDHSIPYNDHIHEFWESYLYQLHLDQLVSGDPERHNTVVDIVGGTLIFGSLLITLLIIHKSREKIKLIRDEPSWGFTYNILTVMIIWALQLLLFLSLATQILRIIFIFFGKRFLPDIQRSDAYWIYYMYQLFCLLLVFSTDIVYVL